MASVVRMPSVLAGATEAAIASWLVAPGDKVAVGDPLAEIETEKALVEYTAEEPGIVGRIVLPAGESGEIGAPIAVLMTDGETEADVEAALAGEVPAAAGHAAGQAAAPPAAAPPAAAPPAAADQPAADQPTAPQATAPQATAPQATAPQATAPQPTAPQATAPQATALPEPVTQAGPEARSVPAGSAGPDGQQPDGNGAVQAAAQARIFASPIVRRLAREKGIDLAAVTGTGPNGRIVRRDLERLADQRPAGPAAAADGAGAVQRPAAAQAAQTAAAAPAAQAVPPAQATPAARAVPAPAAGRLIPHTPVRRAIARRLTESKATTPHFYMATECVVDELLSLRKQVNETAPVKVSVNDFVIMAVAAAFGDVPEANVTWSEEGLIAHPSVDVSIAVATDSGLVTPVLRGVGTKRLSVIAAEAQSLAQRARDRRLLQHELEGGVFSVSNLGMYGTLEFSAIINPPQSGILAVGAARPQPVAVDGSVAVAQVMRCTLSVDHRAIDGALAARWLAAFTNRIENPLGMVV